MKAQLFTIATFFVLSACSDNGKIETSGTIEGTEIIVSSQVSGLITSILKEEGSVVKPGDLLIQVDTTDYFIQLRQVQAVANQAKAQYDLALKGARSEDIKAAREAVASAQASFESAKKDADRFADLMKTNSASQKQADDAKTRLTVSQAQLNQSQELLKKLENGSRPEELSLAKGRFEQAQAQVDQIQKKIRDCSIRAAGTGTVTTISVDQGELVNPGAQIAKITDLSVLKLKIYVKETDLGFVKTGDDVSIKVDSFPDSSFMGKVAYISPVAEFTPKNVQSKDDRVKLVYEVRVHIQNPEGVLKPGMPADALVGK